MFSEDLRGPWLLASGLVVLGVTLAEVGVERFLDYNGYRDTTVYWIPLLAVAIVLPIADRHADYARSVRDQVAAAGFRVELDERQEKIGYKIREAQLQKIPYMLVTGDREATEQTVSVRSRSAGDQGSRTIESFIEAARDEVRRKGQ